MNLAVKGAIIGCVMSMMSTPVVAQSGSAFLDAFAGEWFSFEPRTAPSPGPCNVTLENLVQPEGVLDEAQVRPKALVQNCVAPIDTVVAWGIEAGQLILYSGNDSVVARLGGNPSRISGDMADFVPLVLERQTGDPANAGYIAALRKYRCVFKGYSADCSTQADMEKPSIVGTNFTTQIQTLVDLNVRDQPRQNARVLGVVDRDTCVTVNYCLASSDGVWCRTQLGEAAGWMRKVALRQEEWPIMTFKNSCEAQ